MQLGWPVTVLRFNSREAKCLRKPRSVVDAATGGHSVGVACVVGAAGAARMCCWCYLCIVCVAGVVGVGVKVLLPLPIVLLVLLALLVSLVLLLVLLLPHGFEQRRHGWAVMQGTVVLYGNQQEVKHGRCNASSSAGLLWPYLRMAIQPRPSFAEHPATVRDHPARRSSSQIEDDDDGWQCYYWRMVLSHGTVEDCILLLRAM